MTKPTDRTLAFALVLLLALFCLPRPAAADELTPEKISDIKQLLTLSGSAQITTKLADTLARQITQALRKKRPDLSEKTLGDVEREVRQAVVEKMLGAGGPLDRLVPIYASRFSHEEIRQIVDFYKSPVGRKVAQTLPELHGEAQKLGLQFARELGPEIKLRINEALLKANAAPQIQQ
jgi:hypothetical protein